jgi:ABC-type multidrug transport system ATPase subunit
MCGLAAHRAVPVRQLSGGWHQRVLIGQCLLGEPKGLLLDEPTSALDVGAARECWQLLSRLAASRPVVVATHEASAALEFSDHVVFVNRGRVESPVSGDGLRARRARFDGSVESFILSLVASPPRNTA